MPEWNPAALLQSPLFAPLHPILGRLEGNDFPSLSQWNALLAAHQPPICTQSGQPLRFVPQEQGKLSFEERYEPRCYLNGEVQMRANNWHDLFNALVWMAYPKAKAALNARHYHALTGHHEPSISQRGAARDMATLFDESGVIIACSTPELAGLLHDFQWHALFWQQRKQMQDAMDFYLFGHGLYQKALQPYIGMTGQGLIVKVEKEFFGWPVKRRLAFLDERIATHLDAPQHCRSTRELSPVPLLGVPGWTEDNDCEGYYSNLSYFRQGRKE